MHIKKHHKCQCPRHISSEEVKNCKFIDPCDFKKPKKRIYHAEREKARLERMNSLPKEPLFELSSIPPRRIKITLKPKSKLCILQKC